MKRIITIALCLIFTFSLTGCNKKTTEKILIDTSNTEKIENVSTDNTNIKNTENTDKKIIVVENKILESDGVIAPMDSNELISKLSQLYYGINIYDVIEIFGKEPFMVKEANSNIFKYYSGDIVIILWGTELYQAILEYDNSYVAISLSNDIPLE